jgi:hypothetical protein
MAMLKVLRDTIVRKMFLRMLGFSVEYEY